MKEILIPLNFTTNPTVYDTLQSFSTSDEASGVLTFTTTADVAGTVASLTIRNASENANRQTILIERLDVNTSPFSYALKNPLPFGQYEGTILLKKNLTVIASAVFLFGVNSSLSAEVLPDLVKAYSLDELVENVETEVSNLKDAFNLTVSETVKGVNKTESSLQAQENVRYLNEHQRKANERERIANEHARIAAELERKDTFDTLVDSEVIEQTVAQEVAEKYQEIEALNAPEMVSFRQQLANKATKETYGNFEIKSVNLCGGRGDFTSARATNLLNLIVANGFNSVTIVPTWYMTLKTDNVMFSHPTKTPTDAELITFIADAKALGLHVMLKPHVDCLDGTFRGAITPTNFTTWFANYNTMITGYATMCHTMGVDIFIIGTELKTTTLDPHTTNWLSIIANIRAIYSNKITYATLAGLVDPNEIKFWTSLDYIGANDWLPLTNKADYTSYDVENAWYDAMTYGNIIERAYNQYFKYGKKILITEIGCNKYDLSLSNPSKYQNMDSMGAINLDVPKDFAIAFYKVARKYTDMFIGYSWWCLDLVNPTNTFSFEDKPELQAVMTENNNDDEFVNKSPHSMMSDVFKFIDTFRLGTTSISGIGDGLVKGAIKDIHDRFADDVGAVDANTLKTSGFYYAHGTTNVQYSFGFLIVVGDGTRAVQLNFHNQLTLGFVYRVNDGTTWSGWMFANCSISTTAERPTAIRPGYQHFDSTLGKPIWRNKANTAWVDATGATV